MKNVTEHPDHMIINAVAGKDGSGLIYEDGGNTPDYADNFATTKMESSTSGNTDEYTMLRAKSPAKSTGSKTPAPTLSASTTPTAPKA